jgi:hypothetical protein
MIGSGSMKWAQYAAYMGEIGTGYLFEGKPEK